MLSSEILFATSNPNKVKEAEDVLKTLGISIAHFPFKYTELRSDSLEEIAMDAVQAAYLQCKKPVFVEDTGLFIPSLNGFPGTFSAWVLDKIGTSGILSLISSQAQQDRKAYFETCIAYHDGLRITTYHGRCGGSIALKPAGTSGFGYDSIFVPNGSFQTFAENIELKNKLSHRYNSLLEFSKALTSVVK